MNLSPQWLDELRARTTLSAVIAPSVKLVKAGREFKACCPFHNEKTPSFTINDEKHFYHCFGCGAHGDAIRFLTEARGLPFMDAVRELAGKAGMELPAPDSKAREKSERNAGLIEAMTAAQEWFAQALAGIEGGAARDYLDKRGIGPATVARFGLGLAPDSRGKLKAALDRFGEGMLVEAGLLIQPEDSGKPSYDRFRGRLMFPIRDARGRVIAFGGRILGDGEPKYLNSPDTPLFDKGRTLYNIDRASPASRKAGRLIVVEGYMDVIALDRAGIAEAVAPNGTAVTEAQLQLMWRLDRAPILCFDGDSAGQKAAIRAALRALPQLGAEQTLQFVALPAGQDPDDLVRSGGRAAIDALLAEPESLVDRLWRHERDAAPLTTPEARAGLRQRLIDHSGAIGDPSLRSLYREDWLARFDALVGRGQPARAAPRRGTGRFTPPPRPTSDEARAIGAGGIARPTARALIAGFVNFPEVIADHVETLARLPLADRALAGLRDRLVDLAMSGSALDQEALAPILATSGAANLMGRRSSMGFSFTRRESDPERARRDLAAAIETVAATQEVEKALLLATERLTRDWTEDAFAEQQHLIAARQGLQDRLASLASSD